MSYNIIMQEFLQKYVIQTCNVHKLFKCFWCLNYSCQGINYVQCYCLSIVNNEDVLKKVKVRHFLFLSFLNSELYLKKIVGIEHCTLLLLLNLYIYIYIYIYMDTHTKNELLLFVN
jgi:hypothetical protein